MISLAFLEATLGKLVPWLYVDSMIWTSVGLLGSIVFGGRFVLQWLTSEKKGTVVVPSLFWHMSFYGSCLNFIYFLHIDKLPLILGNCFLPFLYARNLWLYYHPKTKVKDAAATPAAPDNPSLSLDPDAESDRDSCSAAPGATSSLGIPAANSANVSFPLASLSRLRKARLSFSSAGLFLKEPRNSSRFSDPFLSLSNRANNSSGVGVGLAGFAGGVTGSAAAASTGNSHKEKNKGSFIQHVHRSRHPCDQVPSHTILRPVQPLRKK